MIPKLIGLVAVAYLSAPRNDAQTNLAFIGAPAPAGEVASPLTAEAEQGAFSLPPGFTMELVAAEPDIEKVVAINFDHAGRLWAVTATEYPVDGNEQPEEARELYARGGKDRVLVFDSLKGEKLKPRVFADGLAIPLGVLPLASNKVIVAQGPEIFTLTDTNGDGRADVRAVLLSGFGVQDSHLMPHQLTRGPGNWIYFAQGAFNYSQVRTREGTIIPFDQCKVGRFKPDGTQFEIVGWGLNNIWGLVISRHGEMFVQEANDLGYPMVPFQVGANYPGIGMHKAKPYAPWQPPLATHFQMGGTGLSGLALSDDDNGFSGAYKDVFYVANPITSRIQAIRATRAGSDLTLEKLPDFVLTGDTWFRPVAMQFGPDGALYIVDWYNKIISHNEVHRTHPERDRTRSRIWRIRAKGQGREIVNVELASPEALLTELNSGSTQVGNAAWQQIVDRRLNALAPQLQAALSETGRATRERLRALWALEGLQKLDLDLAVRLLGDSDEHVRLETVRALGSITTEFTRAAEALEPLGNESSDALRAEAVRTLSRLPPSRDVVRTLLAFVRAPLNGETVTAQQGGGPILTGDAGRRAFERYLLRAAMVRNASAVRQEIVGSENPEVTALAAVALGDLPAARQFAKVIPMLKRACLEEESLLLASFADHPDVSEALGAMLNDPMQRRTVLKQLWVVRDRVDKSKIRSLVGQAALAEASAEGSDRLQLAELAAAFRADGMKAQMLTWLRAADKGPERVRFLRALGQLGGVDAAVFADAASNAASPAVQLEAVAALGQLGSAHASELLVDLWPRLTLLPRQSALEALTRSAEAAQVLLLAIEAERFDGDDLDSNALLRLASILPEDARVESLRDRLSVGARSTLRLFGAGEDIVETSISLPDAFTIEAWVRLDNEISNLDAIAGGPDYDVNFHDGKARLHAKGRDLITATKPASPNTWTHIALTRSATGELKLYLNGVQNAVGDKPFKDELNSVSIGASLASGGGFAGEMIEFRIWDAARGGDEISRDANLIFAGETKRSGLLFVFPGSAGKLAGRARIDQSSDIPILLTVAEAAEAEMKFAKYRALAAEPGSVEKGAETFSQACAACHSVNGRGGQIGPALNGAGAMGTEALLRSIIAPNAMMESGYRRFAVETRDGEIREGFLVSEDTNEIALRPIGGDDLRINRAEVRSARFLKTSLMPEGLLEAMNPQQISDLFTYLNTLK